MTKIIDKTGKTTGLTDEEREEASYLAYMDEPCRAELTTTEARRLSEIGVMKAQHSLDMKWHQKEMERLFQKIREVRVVHGRSRKIDRV